jgi:D-amino peptidase
MKIYISADFEGATGVTTLKHTLAARGAEFERSRAFWVDDINAMIEGALEAGAREFLVNEAHAEMTYMLPERLRPEARYIQGHIKPDFHMCGIDETFAAAFLFTHSGAGSGEKGVLSHTYVRDFYNVRLNGHLVGELHMNALLAGTYGVPVALVVGDAQTCEEAKGFFGEVTCVATMEGIDRFAAVHLVPQETKRRIHNGAKTALDNLSRYRPKTLAPPYSLEIDFTEVTMATIASFIPGVKRLGSRTVSVTHHDYRTLYNLCLVLQLLTRGAYVKDV